MYAHFIFSANSHKVSLDTAKCDENDFRSDSSQQVQGRRCQDRLTHETLADEYRQHDTEKCDASKCDDLFCNGQLRL